MGMKMPLRGKPDRPTPLAAVLRPECLDDVIGQTHLVGPTGPFRRMVEKKRFLSAVLWGPPGVGKTTIIRAACRDAEANFQQLNATDAKVDEVRRILKSAKVALDSGRQTVVFVDEVHRWNKAQQDVILPGVEEGTIVVIGATTEKPKFAVNSTILSRCMVYEAKPLSTKELGQLLLRIKEYYKLQGRNIIFHPDGVKLLVNRCSGDGRKLVTALETILELNDDNVVAVEYVNAAIPEKHLVFDASGNEHFDLAHAYQEAIQHSEGDDAVYWLAKWLASGEDPAYIARRMMITAFEDCGGNPLAPLLAMAAHYATERTGLPECMIPMAYATVEMAKSRRNKAPYRAIKAAMQDVERGETMHVPPELRAGTNGYTRQVSRTYIQNWRRDAPALEKVEPPEEL